MISVVSLSTEDVRFYATTNQSANHSLTAPEMERGFDAWLAKVKEEAASEALTKAISTLDYHAAVVHANAHEDRYRNGRGDGLEFAATLVHRIKKKAPAAELLKSE